MVSKMYALQIVRLKNIECTRLPHRPTWTTWDYVKIHHINGSYSCIISDCIIFKVEVNRIFNMNGKKNSFEQTDIPFNWNYSLNNFILVSNWVSYWVYSIFEWTVDVRCAEAVVWCSINFTKTILCEMLSCSSVFSTHFPIHFW